MNRERLLWAWRWKGCKAPDPTTLQYTRKSVLTLITGRIWPTRLVTKADGDFVRERDDREIRRLKFELSLKKEGGR